MKVRPLAELYTVIVPDLRGYGASGLASSGYDKRTTASDLSVLLRYLGLDSAVVVGHDGGARVARRWALDRPSEVSALALLELLVAGNTEAYLRGVLESGAIDEPTFRH
ncbi:alpha/beta fold hydrolase [Mycolicibacterium smegmatis]|uniref:alpha/beta fold hydrolase n=1 Tax=Mycolicibacterium smegmatis TaxID=1772 RepID=UPI002647D748|nr:alpha/beta fold hydrolase [Mycolicibacterium smegmatis]